MPLSDFFNPGAWAILPSALEPFLHTLFRAVTPGADQTQPAFPQAALPSSASGDDCPAGYALLDSIAVIEVRGVINRRGGSITFFGMTFSWDGQDSIRAAIDAVMHDASVKAVLLSFDSPGGVAAGVKELADFISAQNAKPIYAYADGLCTSAAYWLAASTGRVFAPITATVGSIGVVSAHVDRSAMNAAMGIRVTYMASGTWKAVGNPDTPLSPTDQAYFQETISKLHEVFRGDVTAKMPVDAADPKAWGDGQCFLAEKALELGLVSGIVTDREELIARINKEIHMDKAELAQKHPDLLAQIQAEVRAEMEEKLQAEFGAQLAASSINTAALVAAVAGKEAAEKVSKLAASGVTAEQLEAIAPMLATPAKEEAGASESGSRAEILAAIRTATSGPVNTQTAPKNDDPVKAAVDRISAIGAVRRM
ncbi:MAG: S49 family peptidase [Deltaproteobacteria bacterium]|jgi:signal peptide peptidase SppA|nr:S49 family peptidase [Deltaproteobacteria bacterium]